MANVSFNPASPAGSDPLSQGDDAIRFLTQQINLAFGGNGLSTLTIPQPFVVDPATGLVSVVGNPTAPLGLVPKQYVDQQLVVAASVAPNPPGSDQFVGATVPDITTPTTWGLYLVTNSASANLTTGPTLQLGSSPPKVIHHADGSTLAIGDFQASQTYVLTFDGSAYRIVSFFGGTLATDPTQDAGAATKHYVDHTVGIPQVSSLPNSVTLTPATPKDLIAASITIPTDGPYVLHVDYGLNLSFFLPAGGGGAISSAWISDGTNKWAISNILSPKVGASLFALAGSGISPVTYTTTPVTITLFAQTDDTGGVQAVQVNPPLPNTYLTVTALRTHT